MYLGPRCFNVRGKAQRKSCPVTQLPYKARTLRKMIWPIEFYRIEPLFKPVFKNVAHNCIQRRRIRAQIWRTLLPAHFFNLAISHQRSLIGVHQCYRFNWPDLRITIFGLRMLLWRYGRSPLLNRYSHSRSFPAQPQCIPKSNPGFQATSQDPYSQQIPHYSILRLPGVWYISTKHFSDRKKRPQFVFSSDAMGHYGLRHHLT